MATAIQSIVFLRKPGSVSRSGLKFSIKCNNGCVCVCVGGVGAGLQICCFYYSIHNNVS